jgi:outer membrane protein OmpA-like peptidoglycan-associated protein
MWIARPAQKGQAMIAMTTTSALTSLAQFTARIAIAAIGVALSLGLIGTASAAEDVTEDQIVRALAGPQKPLTRGLSMAPPAQDEPVASPTQVKFLQSIRSRSARSLSTAEREQIADIAKAKPNIDLEINFEYNSAAVSQKSLASVQALGRALTSPDLKGSTFVVAGHTDAAGSDAYNQDLSERRADSIKRYLVDKYSIPSVDLVTVGYGKSKLKDPSQPLAEVNRRVQVVNMQNKTAASK